MFLRRILRYYGVEHYSMPCLLLNLLSLPLTGSSYCSFPMLSPWVKIRFFESGPALFLVFFFAKRPRFACVPGALSSSFPVACRFLFTPLDVTDFPHSFASPCSYERAFSPSDRRRLLSSLLTFHRGGISGCCRLSASRRAVCFFRSTRGENLSLCLSLWCSPRNFCPDFIPSFFFPSYIYGPPPRVPLFLMTLVSAFLSFHFASSL